MKHRKKRSKVESSEKLVGEAAYFARRCGMSTEEALAILAKAYREDTRGNDHKEPAGLRSLRRQALVLATALLVPVLASPNVADSMAHLDDNVSIHEVSYYE